MDRTIISNIISVLIFVIYVFGVIFAYRAFKVSKKGAYYKRVYIYLTSVVGMLILIITITGFLKLR